MLTKSFTQIALWFSDQFIIIKNTYTLFIITFLHSVNDTSGVIVFQVPTFWKRTIMAFIASNNVLYVFQQSLNVGVFITGQSQPTPRGDCPGGYFQVSRTACFRHSQCPDRSFCWFTPTRTHGICCPYCKYNVHAILVFPLQISLISRIICIWCSFFLFLLFLGFLLVWLY